jgi:3-oxoacyl-[acyl-carrier-protein] synthase II
MADTRIYIHAAAALGPHGDSAAAARRALEADPPPLELKELVKTVVGVPLRQASHFVELATIGSQLCLRQLATPAPENTAVYLGTGFAETRKNEAVFKQVMPPGPGMASPFDFINTANNMAAFYTARIAGFRARNLTVMQEEFSFEWALHLAVSDLQAGDVRQALVGGVDENTLSRFQTLRRISLRPDQPVGEGSGWFYIETQADKARGEILTVRYIVRTVEPVTLLADVVHEWRMLNEPVSVLPGFRLEWNEVMALSAALPDVTVRDYIAQCGYFHSAAAFGLATAFDLPRTQPTLIVHLNRDSAGHLMLVVVRAFAT